MTLPPSPPELSALKPGERAYEAYVARIVTFIDSDPRETPPWEDLPLIKQIAWAAVEATFFHSLATVTAENLKLREALEPFAKGCDRLIATEAKWPIDGDTDFARKCSEENRDDAALYDATLWLTSKHFRAARSALQQTGGA